MPEVSNGIMCQYEIFRSRDWVLNSLILNELSWRQSPEISNRCHCINILIFDPEGALNHFYKIK